MKYFPLKKSLIISLTLLLMLLPLTAWGLASNNIPLDSPVYLYLEKLVGLGLITSDVKGARPYAKAEVARLITEAEVNLAKLDAEAPSLAAELIMRVREQVPREMSLRMEPKKAPFLDYNPVDYTRLRYVYVDGIPRSYNRPIYVTGGQKVFGFIGGNLRPPAITAGVNTQSGSEGTPLLENNEGIVYKRGNNGEMRWAMEGFVKDKVSILVEPLILAETGSDRALMQKGYVKLGSGGLELEVGRDANWFGPGYRGATTLTNNAKNFDMVKLSSPEPLDGDWVKRHMGDFKYALIFSRLDETGTGADLRQPYFIGVNLRDKPRPWYEIGFHAMRMEGGPGFTGSPSLPDEIFGGGTTNHNATTAGFDLRFRIPWLRNTEIYGDYSGSDSAGFWPFVESYVAGFFIPCLTKSGKDDLRFEFFYGNPKLYVDGKFPAGFVYHGMPFGDSQDGGALEFFFRYSHWFSTRNNVALEYFHTDRGREGRVSVNSAGEYDPNGVLQAVEELNAWRAFWTLPLYGDLDMSLMYGWERINNFNLVGGAKQTDQTFKMDLSYRY
jgi:hypothetical protein